MSKGQIMDKETFGKLFAYTLKKYNFKNYGSTLFYLDLEDAIIILKQILHNGGSEFYLRLIIKECHPEIAKITKKALEDDMLIDTHSSNKLLYRTPNGYRWNFFDIEADVFEETIDRFYEESIKPFEISYLNGIEQFNKLYYEIFYGQQIRLYKDSAKKIGHMELASFRGHDWFLSDYYFLTFKCNIDSRYVNSNTERYIIDTVIKNIPEGLNGKELTQWCNKRCKEIFISKKFRRDFGGKITFPFVDGKPLQFCGTDIKDGKAVEVYVNDATGEIYHCRRDMSDLQDSKYELWKVE